MASAEPHSPRQEGLRVSEDATLFILDEEGIFFYEPMQELHVFNTAATYVWCCVEEGSAAEEIAAAYADVFGVSREEGQAEVASLLHRWQGRGYVSSVNVPTMQEIDFTTGLGRLLSNPLLRREFAASASDTARRQSIRKTDRAAYCSLDPQQLERQAEALAAKRALRRSRRRRNPATTSFLSRGGVFPANRALQHRQYRLLSTNVSLGFDSPACESRVRADLGHLAAEVPGDEHSIVEVHTLDGGYTVFADSVPVAQCSDLARVAPLVSAVVREAALEREAAFLTLSASAVSRGEHGLLLPAQDGDAGTALTAALIGSGFHYVSGGVALLEETRLRVRAFPLGLEISAEEWDRLAAYHPGLGDLPVHAREDDTAFRCLAPGARIGTAGADTDVRWMVFPQERDIEGADLRPIGKAAALQRLMSESLIDVAARNRQNVAALVEWIRGVRCYELSYASLAEGVSILGTLP